ncbi:hypothetical protein J3459_010543 [Metarhizium acridum]|uniref:uncharacterized protein n=1 Tax=Metarhizium acridum TaxID=92637 RepID=UPI001C6C71EA|nr:hypothetical protein J3458_020795 [Metarhizium acridum]KAG8422248.1 hypothetical protein J3459_010543 [Metarhizium acridum]
MSVIKSEADSTKMEVCLDKVVEACLSKNDTTDSLNKRIITELYLAKLCLTKFCCVKDQTSFDTTHFVVSDKIANKDPLIKGTLLRMPPEITLHIIEEMDNDVDRLCLGLSCRRLLHFVQDRNIRVPCMKASREARFMHKDNKLAFSMMKRVYPLNASGGPRPDAALCQSCFKWINVNHFATTTLGQGSKTVLSQVVPCPDKTYNLAGLLFECAQCVARDSTPEQERDRRQNIYRISAVSEPTRFCSVAVWTSRVNMHNGSEVDP